MQRQLILSNRSLQFEAPANELPPRIHIVPRGELVNKAAGITQVLDEPALQSILADLQARSSQGGLYMGEEHFIYNSEMSSQAFAWGKEFGLDDQGIWATGYEPTDVGSTALKNKRFKWTSFVADSAQPGAVEKLGPGRVRIRKIDTVGFTNFPNGKGLLSPMFNRSLQPATCPDCGCAGVACDEPGMLRCPDCKKNFADSREPAANQKHNNQVKNRMKNIATKLGLAAEASEDAILAEVTKYLNRAEITPANLTTLQNRKTELETENQTLLGEQCEAILDGCGIKPDDKRRPHLVGSLKLLKNREDRIAHLADFGIKPGEEKKGPGRVLNRQDAGGTEKPLSSDDDKAIADKIMNRANEIKGKHPHRAFADCWTQAQTENLQSK